jgi:hypothetical protein
MCGILPSNKVFSKGALMFFKNRLTLLVSLFLVLAAGCDKGNPNAPTKISGEITYKGKLVTGGNIQFHSATSTYSGTISPEGTYSLTDIPAGEMTVTIETDSVKPRKEVKYGADSGQKYRTSPAPKDFSPKAAGAWVDIPKKYGNKNRSGLKLTLTAGSQTKNWDLE